MKTSRVKAFVGPAADFLRVQVQWSLGLGVATAGVAALAAAVDGRPPEVNSLLRIALPTAGAGGLALSLSQARHERMDVALSALGLRPAVLWFAGLLIALGLCSAAPPPVAPPGGVRLAIGPDRLELMGEPDAPPLVVSFEATGARRSDLGRPWPGLPPPTGHAHPPPAPVPGWLWLPAMGLLLAGLATGPRPPAIGRTLGVLGTTLALAYGLGL